MSRNRGEVTSDNVLTSVRLREDWQLTYELCRGLAKDCAELEIWTPIARFALEGALKAQDKLSLPKDEDWANLSLAYLRICCLSESDNGEKDQGSPLALEPSQILEDLRQSGMDLTSRLAFLLPSSAKLMPSYKPCGV